MKILKVRNLYGYPSYSKMIKEYAASNGFLLILDRTTFLRMSKEERMTDQPKILVDTFTAFIQSEIPIIGFKNHNGFRIRDSVMPHRDFLVPNVCSVRIASNLKRVPAEVLEKVLAAPVKRDFLDSMDPKSADYKVVKAMFSIFLPATLKDPFTPVNTSAGSRVKNRKARESAELAAAGLLPPSESESSAVEAVPEKTKKAKGKTKVKSGTAKPKSK